MQADFVANDFAAIARALRQQVAPPPKVLLRFWRLLTLLDSEHDNLEAAVIEAHERWMDNATAPDHIAAADGTVLMDREALVKAITRYAEGMPI